MLARSLGYSLSRLAARVSVLGQQASRSDRRSLRVGCYSGDQAAPPPPRVGRPSKSLAKQEAKQYQEAARQLARLSEKQLSRLQPLIGEEVVEAVALASRISHRNQGRQRQESLVAKLLRVTVQDAEVEQLQAAIDSVKTGQGVIANPAVERQVQLWLHALLTGDAEGSTQVFGLAQGSELDLQVVRQLVKQAQQTEAAAPAAAGPAADGSSSDEAAAGPDGGATMPARPTGKALKAKRQLRGMLQPLAQAQVAEGDESDEE